MQMSEKPLEVQKESESEECNMEILDFKIVLSAQFFTRVKNWALLLIFGLTWN